MEKPFQTELMIREPLHRAINIELGRFEGKLIRNNTKRFEVDQIYENKKGVELVNELEERFDKTPGYGKKWRNNKIFPFPTVTIPNRKKKVNCIKDKEGFYTILNYWDIKEILLHIDDDKISHCLIGRCPFFKIRKYLTKEYYEHRNHGVYNTPIENWVFINVSPKIIRKAIQTLNSENIKEMIETVK